MISLLVGCVFFLVPRYLGTCIPYTPKSDDIFSKFYCKPDETNDLASLFFSDQEEAIRYLFNKGETINPAVKRSSLFLFFIFYFLSMVVCYGSAVPGALFVPSLLAGAAWGRLIGSLLGQVWCKNLLFSNNPLFVFFQRLYLGFTLTLVLLP